MRILVLGGDGYLGWPTAMYFSQLGHEILVVDNLAKRQWEAEIDSIPLQALPTLRHRVRLWEEVTGKEIGVAVGDIAENHRFVYDTFGDFEPEAVIHYAEQPSAPYSMAGRDHAVYTQRNNVIGNLNVLHAMQKHVPDAHLVKLGTMGEYGTPNIDIEEGWLDVELNGRKDRLPFPKLPGSFYHLSKVHDSHNIHFACRVWGTRCTDLNQGVVYGITTDETELHPDLHTSFHYDAVFGTVLNRYCVQAVVGEPLTVYGAGGQRRGFLNIRDTLQCVRLAVENPADKGEFRVFNQFTEVFSVLELAEMVVAAAKHLGMDAQIAHIDNPRVEAEEHYYNPRNDALLALGLTPRLLSEELVEDILSRVARHADSIDRATLLPTVRWRHADVPAPTR
ncbi:MAG: NAD-dependent epimerase/dehydratase family protein [Gaiellaceae bacterium MAG52_C11]|nr:NAD-dependent epimerase/dehydratase family protein [Candidatus Gaiellasilicea maunaloa]